MNKQGSRLPLDVSVTMKPYLNLNRHSPVHGTPNVTRNRKRRNLTLKISMTVTVTRLGRNTPLEGTINRVGLKFGRPFP